MGPWFTEENYIITCDPLNIHHIMSKNFDNYVKGSRFRDIFEPFGNGLVGADSEIWKYKRAFTRSLMQKLSFDTMSERTIQKKVQNSLLPIFDHACLHGKVLDLQDVFSRLMFDETSIMVLGYDPKSLSIEFPPVNVENAFDEVQECVFYRNMVPISVWKFQEWLQIGSEKKLTKARKVFDQFLYSHIAAKRQELKTSKCNNISDDLLTEQMMMTDENGKMVHDDKFLRDASFNLFAAGRDTITSGLTWFFWLVATHPSVEAKILEEIEENFGDVNGKKRQVLGIEDVKKLVYLHGALCESLRLFPPIPVERPRTCLGKDVSLFQMKIIAATILGNYHIQVVKNHPVTPAQSIMLLMKHGLKVNTTRRQV
ncbi:hypothetical protein PIB30_049225 [Stylosanthes scabra]|uniref:Cytochrome P450 n=1 Tax=Stylosanthes scabra TaxID=79078 RepID=A0ABU6ZG12_9FABA|nr:hypothetical protein [Stylosanthes scabra]